MKKLLSLVFVCSVASLSMNATLAVTSSVQPLSAVPSFDLSRYQGTWYEISKFPNYFQKKCVGGNTRAEYTLLSDNEIQVVNRCKLADGNMNEGRAIGRKATPDDSAKLEVNFAPNWLSFLPFVWGNYWVVDLDKGYQLAAVSEPNREYLWVLSRTKTVDPAAYSELLSRLKNKGFDITKLELTAHNN